MVSPNFFVVGAQKSGTTSLHHYLMEHPDVFLPAKKETKFFVNDSLYEKGLKFYNTEYFSNYNDEKMVGEVDPDYMYFHKAAERINQSIKNPKFIFVFRNPAERAFSHYVMTYRRGLEQNSFEQAIEIEAKRIAQSYEDDFHYSYVKRGFYFDQVSRFLEKWDVSNMHFVLSEDLIKNPAETVKKCFEFLGVNSDFVPEKIGKQFHQASVPKNLALTVLFRNKEAYPVIRKVARLFFPSLSWRNWLRAKLVVWNNKPSNLKLSSETRHQLINLYQEQNLKLSALIERDLEHWNKNDKRS